MISARPLALEVSTYQALRGRLLTEWPEIDEETLANSLEGITDLHEMIAVVIRSALVDEALHAGLRFRVDDMKERLSRLELRVTKKRQLALEAMTEVGLAKLEQPDFTASTRAGSPALVVIAKERIPKPTGCHSHPSSTGKAFSASSSVALRSLELSSATLSRHLW